jgi:hypothetical protein
MRQDKDVRDGRPIPRTHIIPLIRDRFPQIQKSFGTITERLRNDPRRLAVFGLVAAAGVSGLLHPASAQNTSAQLDLTRATTVVQLAGTRTPTDTKVTNQKHVSPTATAKAPAKAVKTTPAKVTPVAGLNQAQMNNAVTIVHVGQRLGISKRGQIVAVATAMQESNLYNRASHVVPESLKYPHQGTGSDHDSVGLFQQRYTTGWGTVKDIMIPAESAKKFYRALLHVRSWQSLSITVAAQRVQGSAFPNAYAKHQSRATAVVTAVNKVK